MPKVVFDEEEIRWQIYNYIKDNLAISLSKELFVSWQDDKSVEVIIHAELYLTNPEAEQKNISSATITVKI